MTFHPHARIFGKTTATAFNSPCNLELEPGWSARYACGDAYRIDDPHDYLTHDDLPVYRPIWLRPDDVANGKDTVVEAARDWINGQTPYVQYRDSAANPSPVAQDTIRYKP